MTEENENPQEGNDPRDESVFSSEKPDPAGKGNGAEKASEKPLEERLAEAEKKAEDNFNDFLYLKAEFENYKKRMGKERTDLLKFGNEKTILEFLPVIDNLNLALDSAKNAKDTQAIVEGLEMTYKQLVGIFENLGCEFINSVGEAFDPNKHEAMMHKESKDVDPDIVLQEFQKGCLLNGRLLRPSKVIVSKELKDN